MYVFLRSVDIGATAATFDGGRLPLLVPATVMYFAGLWLRSARWQRLIAPFADVPTSRLLRVLVIGFAVNNLLPLRLGELVRTFLIGRSHRVPFSAALGSILIERVFDVLALCGIMAAVSAWVALTGWLAAVAALSWLVVTGAVVATAVYVAIPRRHLERLVKPRVVALGRFSPRLAGLGRSFRKGLSAMRTPRRLAVLTALSVVSWIAELGLYYFVMLVVGFDSGIQSLAVGMVVANLATVIPSSPGYVGTFDVPLQAALVDGFGVSAVTAASYTLLTHAVLLVPVVVVGLVLLSREDLSLKALGHGRVEARSANDGTAVGRRSPFPE